MDKVDLQARRRSMVPNLIQAEFHRLGVGRHSLGWQETVLIQNGVYAGKKYCAGGHTAIWNETNSQLLFYDNHHQAPQKVLEVCP